MTHVVTEYFNRELQALGYEPNERQGSAGPTVWWSLSYSQGDGMAWDGRLDTDKLVERLTKGVQKRLVKKALEKGSIYCAKVSHSGSYYHWNSMTVELDLADDSGLTDKERQAFDAFVKDIDEDVKETSRRLEKEGYKLLEGINPAWWCKKKGAEGVFAEESYFPWRTITIGRFRTEIKLVEDRYFNPYRFGDADPHNICKQIVAGELVSCGIIVEIYVADDDVEIGSDSLWGVMDKPDMKYIKGDAIAQVLSEAIADARNFIEKVSA